MSEARRSQDRDLLFGVLALRAGFLDAARFAEACDAWAVSVDVDQEDPEDRMSLPDILVARGWIEPEARDKIEFLLDLKNHSRRESARVMVAEFDSVSGSPNGRGLPAGRGSDVDFPDPTPSIGGEHEEGPDADLLATTDDLGDRYRLTSLHAQGGIGRVWLARDASIGRDVALKQLRPERTGDIALHARFVEEARITGQLEHPGIVPVYELSDGSSDRPPFYTMRFVRGRTLTEAIRDYHDKQRHGQGGPLGFNALLNAFVGVCNTIAYAHSQAVVHRDLKGANVILGDYGEVMVLDWGLAKVLGEASAGEPDSISRHASASGDSSVSKSESATPTACGQVLGTPAYMAPEQAACRSEAIGIRTDVYGLGAILYEILTDRPPFRGADTREVLEKVRTEPPPTPRSICPWAPRALEAICLKALAKQPEQRYESAGALAEDVRRWLADEPVSVMAEDPARKLARWGRRHRPLVASAAVLIVTVSIASAIGWVWVRKAHTEQLLQAQKIRTHFTKALAAFEGTIREFQGNDRIGSDAAYRKPLLDAALASYQKLLNEHRDDPALRREVGNAFLTLGAYHREAEDFERALEAYDQGRKILGLALADDPDDTELLAKLGAAHRYAGMLRSKRGQHGDALVAYRQALPLDQALARTNPENNLSKLMLARAYNQIGSELRDLGRTTESLASFENARRILDAEGKSRTHLPDGFRSALSVTYCFLGGLQIELNRRQDALGSFRQAFALLENFENASALDHYNLACAHAMMSVLVAPRPAQSAKSVPAGESPAVRKHQDLALKALDTAVGLGFADLNFMKEDKDLDPIRGRKEEYGKIVAKMKVLSENAPARTADRNAARSVAPQGPSSKSSQPAPRPTVKPVYRPTGIRGFGSGAGRTAESVPTAEQAPSSRVM